MASKFVFLNLFKSKDWFKSRDWFKSGVDWFKSVGESSPDSADGASEGGDSSLECNIDSAEGRPAERGRSYCHPDDLPPAVCRLTPRPQGGYYHQWRDTSEKVGGNYHQWRDASEKMGGNYHQCRLTPRPPSEGKQI